jgi:hypothetical protein
MFATICEDPKVIIEFWTLASATEVLLILVKVKLDASLLEKHLELRNYDMMHWAQT